jgi:hypothetical protein
MSSNLILSGRFYYSYSQFMVFDRSVKLPGCAWTDAHFLQGFARRDQNVCFGTLSEFGHADLNVYLAPYETRDEYERVVEVPLKVLSTEIAISGPEEYPEKYVAQVTAGDYRLVSAQATVREDLETIDLYLERLAFPLAGSRIIVADGALRPPSPLLETAEVA